MEEPVRSLLSHQSWLRRLARRLVRSPAAADDLVQDTCVTALRVAPPDADMRPWLRGVMRHLASHYVRGERRRIAREDSYQRITSSIAAPDGILEYGVGRERLRDIVESLPEPFRSTVVQRYLEGLSCAEIARAHRVPAGTVRWRQTRALELLRSRLEDGARTTRRRRRLFWPFAGAGSSLSAGRSLLPVPGRGSLVAVGLAGLVAIIGLGLRTGADDSVAEAHPVSDSFLGRLSLVATSELGADPNRSGAGGPYAPTRAGRGAGTWSSNGRRAQTAPGRTASPPTTAGSRSSSRTTSSPCTTARSRETRYCAASGEAIHARRGGRRHLLGAAEEPERDRAGHRAGRALTAHQALSGRGEVHQRGARPQARLRAGSGSRSRSRRPSDRPRAAPMLPTTRSQNPRPSPSRHDDGAEIDEGESESGRRAVLREPPRRGRRRVHHLHRWQRLRHLLWPGRLHHHDRAGRRRVRLLAVTATVTCRPAAPAAPGSPAARQRCRSTGSCARPALATAGRRPSVWCRTAT